MYGNYGQPGVTTLNSTAEREILWGGDESRIEVLRLSRDVSSAMADAGNTPTSVVRKGNLLGIIAASGLLTAWDATLTTGAQYLAGVLPNELTMVDEFGTAVTKRTNYIVRAPLKASQLLIKGAAFVGHADEYLARRQLWHMGCRLDDDPCGYKAGVNKRIQAKITDYTVVAADNGTEFHATTANATFTLPAIKAGLNFTFTRTDNFNLVVASAEGDNMLVGNDAAADSVTWSTSSNKTGARIYVEAVYIGSTLTWVPQVLAVPFSTGAFLTQTLAT